MRFGRADPIEMLITACLDDQRTLDQSGGMVDDRRARALGRLADERERFVHDLQTEGRTLNHTPRARTSWLSLLRQLWFDVWTVAAGRNAGDTFAACRRSQDRLEAHYEEALHQSWSTQIRPVVVDQHARIREARSLLIDLQYASPAR